MDSELKPCPFCGREQELAIMVRSLLHSLSHYDSNHPKIKRYKDYLIRYGLQGNPLRSRRHEPPTP